jgi:hypothetical protein
VKSLNRKVGKLEEQLLPDVEHGSTTLFPLLVDIGNGPDYFLCLEVPKAEAFLQKRAYEIRQLYDDTKDVKLTKEHRKVLLVAGKRLFDRSLDLFENVWGLFFDYYSEGDPILGKFFRMRLYWFINEMFRHADIMRKESELGKKYPKNFKKFEKEFNEWYNKRENQTPLWTRDSFSEFIKPAFRTFEEVKRNAKKKPQQSSKED